MSWYPDRLLKVLLGWTLFTAALPTIVTYRAALQPQYEWGLYGLGGVGVNPAYFFVVATGVLAWLVVILGYRGARRPFSMLFLVWHGFLFASIAYGVTRFGSEMELRGDAMGLRVNIALLGPVLTGAILLAGIVWIWRSSRRSDDTTPPRWRRHSRMLMGAGAALTIAIVVLFRLSSGGVHHNDDRIAIVFVVVQVFLFARALEPEKPQ